MPRVLNELLKLERLLFCSFHVLGALKVLNAIILLTFLSPDKGKETEGYRSLRER